jgi:hypothetical protein
MVDEFVAAVVALVPTAAAANSPKSGRAGNCLAADNSDSLQTPVSIWNDNATSSHPAHMLGPQYHW